MDVLEICAEKLRTVSDRARYRDFYDLFIFLKKYDFDEEEIIEIVKKKELRKPIKRDLIFYNWKIARQQQDKVTAEIYVKEEISNESIEQMITGFRFTEIKK